MLDRICRVVVGMPTARFDMPQACSSRLRPVGLGRLLLAGRVLGRMIMMIITAVQGCIHVFNCRTGLGGFDS